jgi:hypothetical protein
MNSDRTGTVTMIHHPPPSTKQATPHDGPCDPERFSWSPTADTPGKWAD